MNSSWLRGMRSPFGGLGCRGNPFNPYGRQSLSGYGGHSGYGGCTTCVDDPWTQDHICQCHEAVQLPEVGQYLIEECDCLDCPFMGRLGYDNGLYPGYGRGIGRGYGNIGTLFSRNRGGLGMRGYARLGGMGGMGGFGGFGARRRLLGGGPF